MDPAEPTRSERAPHSSASRFLLVMLIVSAALFYAAMIPMIYVMSVFAGFGSVEEGRSVTSRDGKLRAWLRIYDAGALGGSTAVLIRDVAHGEDVEVYGTTWQPELGLVWAGERRLVIRSPGLARDRTWVTRQIESFRLNGQEIEVEFDP